MKLKDGIVVDVVCGSYVVVPTGENRCLFSGMIRNNETAHFLYKRLQENTTEDALTKALLDTYRVDADTAGQDVHRIVSQLRRAGLLDE